MNLQHNQYGNNLAIYIHWPFCESKCPYCDFNSYVTKQVDYELWQKAYLQQIEYFYDTIAGKHITSIFFGGGTPSLMAPKIAASIIEKIASIAKLDGNTEITLEANPSSVEFAKFKDFRQAGINRISLGVQSIREESLKFLGRKHSAKEAQNAMENIGSIFDNWSFDLIYALPGQSVESWESELGTALKLASSNKHISCYQLTIEKGTEFAKMYYNNEFALPIAELATEIYTFTNEFLQNNGYTRYEISNYAKQGFQSKHNLAYWNYDDYVGIGPGAHGRISYKNTSDEYKMQAMFAEYKPDKWLAISDANANKKLQLLSTDEVSNEILLMGTRLTEGISDQKVKFFCNKDFATLLDAKQIEYFTKLGFLHYENEILKLSDRGLLVHNYIVPRLF